jgi:hypothetical protein
MKRKGLFWGMAVLVLTFGLVWAGCSGHSPGAGLGDGDGTNPFIGSWSGTATFYGQTAPATIAVTDSTWSFNVPAAPMYETGTYTYSGNTATLRDASNLAVGTATVSGSTLTVSLTASEYAGGYGTFHK